MPTRVVKKEAGDLEDTGIGAQMMKRDPGELANKEFDLIVVGGGIFGACAAHDAAMRGLSVALIEKDDFCSGTSANSFKIVHGGIRYLQHMDLSRLYESCGERSALLRIAPHLVQPLPIVIPTYGHGKSGKAFLGSGMLVYDLLTLHRNRGIRDRERRIPWTRFLGKREVVDLFPDINREKLTGAAIFNDAQMYNPTRLVLAFVRSAAENGAVVSNYVEATGFIEENGRIAGVTARDNLTDTDFSIRARSVLNAAGPWAEGLLDGLRVKHRIQPTTYSRDACFVVKRLTRFPMAIAVQGRTRDPDAVLARPARHLFVVPWRQYSLIGVWHMVHPRSPDAVCMPADHLASFIDEINWALPSLELTAGDVQMWNAGLVPFGENQDGSENLSYGKRSVIIDHGKNGGPAGLFTLIGIRYTMARRDAGKAMQLISGYLGMEGGPPPTATTPIFGGDIADFDDLVEDAARKTRLTLSHEDMKALVHNYGTHYTDVLRYAEADRDLGATLGDTHVLAAELVHGIECEMAVNLKDLVFRRTDLATGGHPGRHVLLKAAQLAGRRLHWSPARISEEIAAVEQRFRIDSGS